jgi:beta-mannosidase
METLSLKGIWNLKRVADGSLRPMAIPGDILSALIASGEAPDPYYDRNELSLQWIGREDWLLERDIEVRPEILARERILLKIEVLDTVAEVRVNGEALGSSANMFRSFAVDAKRLLRPGSNRLSVLIRSPELAAAEAAKSLRYPVPYSSYPVASPHRNLIRKTQCMSGWDWGPCLMTGGIYDDASLVALDGPSIEYATVRMRREGESWRLSVTAWLDCPAAGLIDLTASVGGLSGADAPLAKASGRFELAAGSGRATLDLTVTGAQDWWPLGYGKQPLYRLTLRAAPAASPESGHELQKRIGFRELVVVNEDDAAGRSMTFRVNGRDVFCKGANWIPADALPSRWTRERLDDLVSSAADANMNCLRVWGGGRYESDYFYDLCDEKGILIWQDCMFACSLYPSEPAFLAEVEAELRHQVKRLMAHPSLALWCGNNENLGALGWYEESKKNPMRYIVDYDRLYEGTVGRVVKELDPERPWWPTSPCGGPSDFADNWHTEGRGDMHFWSVWHEGKSFSEYLNVKPRFCSEFGFQSLPSPAMVAYFAPEGERNVTSPTMEHHQRHGRGNAIIMETMARYFRMPKGTRETLYLSQVQQAWAIKTAVEYWRTLRPLCMGALYWQLNDVWPVSSWSSLDYNGNWKLLHYEARRFFESLHLALIVKEGIVSAVVVNDGLEAYTGRLELKLRLLDGAVAAEYEADAAIAADSSTRLWSMAISDLPRAPGEAFLDASLSLRSSVGTREKRSAQAFLTEPKRCSLPESGLKAKVIQNPAGLELVLHTQRPAFYVAPSVEGPAGRFEDSGFNLMPGEERRLLFLPARGPARGQSRPSAESLKATLRIQELRASYE